MIHAYTDLYLDSSLDILGHAFDWVVNTCGEELTIFCSRFAKSKISELFSSGYPRYVAGCNGAELVNFVMEDLGLPEYTFEHEFYADKSPEYWTGWVIAYFQWERNLTFKEIFQKIPVEKVLNLYYVGHEQDIRNVSDILIEWIKKE